MKRFDRATYLLFLLVLLADVALAHASVPAGGDASGSILRAAGQLQVSPAGESIRNAGSSSLRVTGRKRSKLSFAAWPGNLFHPSSYLGHSLEPGQAMLSASAPDAGLHSALIASCSPLSPSLGIFEHSGSPAP
jgi:hypothetical protein